MHLLSATQALRPLLSQPIPSTGLTKLLAVFLVCCTASLFFGGCAAPRSSLYSAQALPKRHFQVTGDMAVNAPTQSAASIFDGLTPLLDRAAEEQKPEFTEADLHHIITALLAQSIDPLGASGELGIAYGFARNWQFGYAHASGTHILHLQNQFMGPSAGDSSAANAWCGSLVVQFSQGSFDLPSAFGLDKLQKILDYEFTRRDLYLPFVFGKPIGKQGRYGSLSLGPAFGIGFVEYGTRFLDVLEKLDDGTTRPLQDLNDSFRYPYYGGFLNARLGYGHVFAVIGFAAFWQDYGRFNLFGTQAHLSGRTGAAKKNQGPGRPPLPHLFRHI